MRDYQGKGDSFIRTQEYYLWYQPLSLEAREAIWLRRHVRCFLFVALSFYPSSFGCSLSLWPFFPSWIYRLPPNRLPSLQPGAAPAITWTWALLPLASSYTHQKASGLGTEQAHRLLPCPKSGLDTSGLARGIDGCGPPPSFASVPSLEKYI